MPYALPPAPPAIVRVEPSEFSPLTASTSAALLGQPMSLSYPRRSLPVGFQVASVPAKSQPTALKAEEKTAKEAYTASNCQGRAASASQTKCTLVEGSFEVASLWLFQVLPAPNTKISRLVAQERGGPAREFQIPTDENPPPTQTPPTSPATAEGSPPSQPVPITGSLELTADRQEYDAERQVVTAEGNVVLRFQQAVLSADRVEINIQNRLAVADGDVALRRGEQVLRGSRFEYFFAQDSGAIANASGEFNQVTADEDFTPTLPNDVGTSAIPQRSLSDRILRNQPLQQVTSTGGAGTVVGSDRDIPTQAPIKRGGDITRVRFQAERVEFEGLFVQATNVRITNDPFSPPELELRADRATFSRVAPLVDEVRASRPRLVFDQGLEVPLLRNRIVIDRRERDPAPFNIGFDGDDRGGFFLERTFEIYNSPTVRFTLTPQYLVQRAVENGSYLSGDAFGLKARLDANISPRTAFQGRAVFTSLDLGDIENEFRGSLRLQQTIGTSLPHNLNLEYSYRDRLFNGSLGFQTVQSSLGLVLTSPTIDLGDRSTFLTYQAGLQFIDAETDRLDLLKANRKNNRVDLTRYQGSASVSRGFLLWQGEALPANSSEGLRYSPTPVVPYLQLNASVTGVATAYSSGDSQNSVSANIRLQGQIGNFSKPYFDYTGFNIGYSQTFPDGESPFLFDRTADTKVLYGGITQQLYGPLRVGVQTSLNLDTGEQISTDYFVEYSRRTYNIVLRYNPVLEVGSISFRLNDFNWGGNAGSFSGDARPVVQGVTR